ncbi:MAG: hypothetical protein AAFU73_00820 [Planctomycetota bacterium]
MSYTTSRPVELPDMPDSWDPLPYHVAIVPLRGDEVRVVSTDDRSGASLDYDFADSISEIGHDPITINLRDALATNVFSYVTVLEAPDADVLQSLEPDELDAYWLAASQEVQADLILDVDSFVFETVPDSRSLPQSFFLFLTGPFELLFPDREYNFDGMTLGLSLYDVSRLAQHADFEASDRATLKGLLAGAGGDTDSAREDDQVRGFRFADTNAVVREFRVQPNDLPVRFGDRLGKGPASLSFWKTLVWPSPWLETENPGFDERLSTDAALALAQDLAREVIEGDHDFIVFPSMNVAGLLLDSTSVEVENASDVRGAVVIRAPIRRPRGQWGESFIALGGMRYPVRVVERLSDASAIVRDQRLPAALVTEFASDNAASDLAHEIAIYVPNQLIQAVPSSASVGSDSVAAGSRIQLSLSEDVRGFDESQSWTFDLAGVLDEAGQMPSSSSTSATDSGGLIEASASANALERGGE